MNLIEALKELKEGKKIKNKYWTEGKYIEEDGSFYFDENEEEFTFDVGGYNDLYSDKWMLYISEEEILIKKGKLFDIAKYCENNSCVDCILREEDECDGGCVMLGNYRRLNMMLLDDTFLLDDWTDDKTDRLYKLIQEKK